MRPSIACAALLLAATAGCAYVPPLSHQYNAGDLQRLVPGHTTRAEAEELLRSPVPLRSGDRIMICEQSRHAGYFALVGEGGAGVAPIVTQRYRILLEFDSTEVLRRLEVEPKRSEDGDIPGVDTTWGAFPYPSESLSAGSPWADPPRDLIHLAAARSGVLAAVDARGRLWVWSKHVNGPPYRVVLPRRGPIKAIALTPDGRNVACLSNDLAFVELPTWDFVPGGLTPLEASWTQREAAAMALAPDGARVAVIGKQGELRVLDSRDGEVVASFASTQDRPPIALAWSPDARWLAAIERSRREYSLTLRALDAPEAPSLTVPIGAHPGPAPPAIAFSPDGRRIAINRGTHVELWRATDPRATGSSVADSSLTAWSTMDSSVTDSGLADWTVPDSSATDSSVPDWSATDSTPVAPEVRLEDAFLLPYASQRPGGGAAALSLSFDAGSKLLIAGNGRALAYALDGSRRRWRYSTPDGPPPLVLDLMVDPADGRLVGCTTRGLFTWDPPSADLATSDP